MGSNYLRYIIVNDEPEEINPFFLRSTDTSDYLEMFILRLPLKYQNFFWNKNINVSTYIYRMVWYLHTKLDENVIIDESILSF